MSKLPVIVGFGGVNAAGRGSMHHSYRRLVLDQLPGQDALETKASLANLMGLLRKDRDTWLNADGEPVELDGYLKSIDPLLKSGTLIRKLDNNLFDPDQLLFHRKATLCGKPGEPLSFLIRHQHLPETVPEDWRITDLDDGSGQVRVETAGSFEVLTQNYRSSAVNSAGQLPRGFEPKDLYASRNHPRGLQMTVYGASDAIRSMGIDWETITGLVAPDQISVYAGSGMSQLDYNGNGGMMQARLLGKKVTSKQLPLGFAEMPADFINAYLLGNLGTTGTSVAACATFLYNLRQGIRDIQQGTHRVAIVGTSEAPLMPEIIDGYATMGALADDATLRQLDAANQGSAPDYARACRPFGNNAGFTLAESAQYVVLCDDDLALELGATIYGAINDVFINADGYKKSIASPGVGNYITMAKAAAATRNIIGDEGLRQRSYVQAHGTGTPQNRVTESHIMNEVAGINGIEKWPVAALKSYIGHSLASSAADQLVSSLGLWRYGIIPGILTTDAIAADVQHDNLDILLKHREVGSTGMDAVLINSKGFGGNNATASVLAPHVVRRMLEKKHGAKKLSRHARQNEVVAEAARHYDTEATAGKANVIYRFDNNVLDGHDLTIDRERLSIKGQKHAVDLKVQNLYADMCDETTSD